MGSIEAFKACVLISEIKQMWNSDVTQELEQEHRNKTVHLSVCIIA